MFDEDKWSGPQSWIFDGDGGMWTSFDGQSVNKQDDKKTTERKRDSNYLAMLIHLAPNGTELCRLYGNGQFSGHLTYDAAADLVYWAGPDWSGAVAVSTNCSSTLLRCANGNGITPCYTGGDYFVRLADGTVVYALLSQIQSLRVGVPSPHGWALAWSVDLPSYQDYALVEVGGLASDGAGLVLYSTQSLSNYFQQGHWLNQTTLVARNGSGALVWQHVWPQPQAQTQAGSPMVDTDSGLTVLGHDGIVSVFHTASGQLLWERLPAPANQSNGFNLVALLGNGAALANFWTPNANSPLWFAFSLLDGSLLWQNDQLGNFPWGAASQPLVQKDQLAFFSVKDYSTGIMQVADSRTGVLSTDRFEFSSQDIQVFGAFRPRSNTSACSLFSYTGTPCYPGCVVCVQINT